MTHLNGSHDGVINFMRGSRCRRLSLQLGMIILTRMLRLQPPEQTLAINKVAAGSSPSMHGGHVARSSLTIGIALVCLGNTCVAQVRVS